MRNREEIIVHAWKNGWTCEEALQALTTQGIFISKIELLETWVAMDEALTISCTHD